MARRSVQCFGHNVVRTCYVLDVRRKLGNVGHLSTLALLQLLSNGNDIEAKQNEASILRHFLYRSETKKLILKL